MDCLRSFIIKIEQQGTFTTPQVKTWTTLNRHGWVYDQIQTSNFNIQGFKNIDIYGVEMIGSIQNQKNAVTGNCVVTDFSFDISFDGQLPLISGVVSPVPENYYNIYVNTLQARRFNLSKFTPKATFTEPINSVKNILFGQMSVSGNDWDTANTVSLDYRLGFVFYYKYEGE
jgi:hypothetical protein